MQRFREVNTYRLGGERVGGVGEFLVAVRCDQLRSLRRGAQIRVDLRDHSLVLGNELVGVCLADAASAAATQETVQKAGHGGQCARNEALGSGVGRGGQGQDGESELHFDNFGCFGVWNEVG